MKLRILISVLGCALLLAIVFPFCDGCNSVHTDEPNKITLVWNKGYAGQNQEDVMRGMIWCLSWLGADLPKGCMNKSCGWIDSTHVTINLDSVGFNETAKMALRFICDSIRRSEEYKTLNGIDMGEFVMLTLGSSWHYYKITGVPKTYDEFRRLHSVDTSSYVFGVTQSTISEGHRRIYFSRDTSLMHIGFAGEEGTGSLMDGTFKVSEYECFDLMPNGQLRFMIYDLAGNLASGTPESIGDAGKPTKCLWCHETHVQPLFIDNHEVAGMLTNKEFLTIRDSVQTRLDRYRLSLSTDMYWKNQANHTLGELLYITYMEPTSLHIAREWHTDTMSVQRRLVKLVSKPFEEIRYVGFVYDRFEVDMYDSISNLEVPESARETGREVNYFQ